MTAIEWTDKTWNPLVGCSIVSPGRTNCYAMRQAARIERMSAPRPVRLQRKRAKGFDLQAVSRAANGLPGRAVTRPGDFGNPFIVGQWFRVGGAREIWRWQWCEAQIAKHDARFTFVVDTATAVAMYQTMVERKGPFPFKVMARRAIEYLGECVGRGQRTS